MAKTLERDLGLYAVFTIAVGAMMGSGIFVLPSLAADITGPAAMLAYVLAGVVVIPAALSQSEMATAMPESGGTYLYIDRALGPLMGTVAGFGVWFSLVFKTAFALAGLAAYLEFVADIPGKGVALGIAAALIGLNLVGVKKTGRFQALLVTGVLALMAAFTLLGATEVSGDNLSPFATEGLSGLLTATAVVFVSYAGVTKIASVAEEIERPGRNIPLGMLLPLGVMMVVYPAIVFVIVGVTPPQVLAESTTPVATAAEQFLGSAGVEFIAAVAIVALIGMANAGLLTSSRYPFAMSRNSLAPSFLGRIGSRGTPVFSILVTGAVVLALIAFVPLLDLAKLASAFQLLMLCFVNLALIAFRESRLNWYRPEFHSPLYPWVQIFGIFATLGLLTLLGPVPLLGAVGITAAGVLWYRIFGQSRASRESASLDALRLRATDRLVALTESALASEGKSRILLPLRRDIGVARERAMLRLARHLVEPDGVVDVVSFEEVPEQLPVSAASRQSAEDVRFEDQTGHLASEITVEVEVSEAVSHDRRRALLNRAWEAEVDLVLGEIPRTSRRTRRFVSDMRWLRDNLERDSVFLAGRDPEEINQVTILGSGGPYDVLKIDLAHRIAVAEHASLRLVHLVPPEASSAQIESIDSYHAQLNELCEVSTVSVVESARDLVGRLTDIGRRADLVIVGAAARRRRLFTDLADRLAEDLDSPVLLVHAYGPYRPTLVGSVIERLLY